MRATAIIVRITAAVLFVVALTAAAVPACAMPACDTAAPTTCSTAAPACAGCETGQPVLMKHGPDEGITISGLDTEPPAALTDALGQAEPALITFTVTEPEQTAAPPPLDPLGARLII